jgi:hypothetical protein
VYVRCVCVYAYVCTYVHTTYVCTRGQSKTCRRNDVTVCMLLLFWILHTPVCLHFCAVACQAQIRTCMKSNHAFMHMLVCTWSPHDSIVAKVTRITDPFISLKIHAFLQIISSTYYAMHFCARLSKIQYEGPAHGDRKNWRKFISGFL